MQIDLRPTDDNDKVSTFEHKHWSMARITPKNNPYSIPLKNRFKFPESRPVSNMNV